MTTARSTTQERWRAILAGQPVLPAPMCNISDHAFRTVIREGGATLAYTQMVSAEGLHRDDQKTFDILDLQGGEPMLGMQLFGCDPDKLAESARRLEELGAAVVDINMGCPARKVTSGMGGSALLRMPELVRRILRAMRAVLRGPFTAKLRWDWDDRAGAALEIARIAEGEGVDGLCLHARTREEGYSGRADWNRIRQMKEAVSIPVVGNGDVRRPEDARAMMRETGCDGVMIGRGVIGSPWLVGRALRAVQGGEAAGDDVEPDWPRRREIMLHHAGLMIRAKGEKRGLVQFRKHAVAYIKGMPGARALRPKLMHVTCLDHLNEVLPLEEPMAEIEDNLARA